MRRAPMRTVATELVASFAVAFTSIGMTISLAALVFAGPLASGLPRAVSSFVLGSAIVMGVIGWKSKVRPVVGIIQDGPAVVVVSIATTMSVRSEVDVARDVLVLIGGITLLSGLSMIVLSHIGFGVVGRSLPATLVSSFLAGTGWLLIKGGFEVMLRRSLGLGDLSEILTGEPVVFWLPGAVLGLVLYLAGRWDKIPSLGVSCLVVAGIVGFFVVAALVSSVEAAEADGWLIGPFPDGSGAAVIEPSEVKTLGWSNIVHDVAAVLSVVIIANMVLLLNLSGLERIEGKPVDFDHELRVAGVANVVVAPLGCLVGFHAVGRSALARQMGAKGRIVPVCASLCCFVFAMVGGKLVGYTPRLVAGGLLVAVGLGLFHSWARELAAPGLRLDRVLSVIIVLSIAIFGILQGVVLGAVGLCVVFVIRYSRIDPIRSLSVGEDLRSRSDRTGEQRRWIDGCGADLSVFELQGYLFFGSVTALADKVRDHLTCYPTAHAFVVLDLRHVTGIDTSGLAMLRSLVARLVAAGGSLVISDSPRSLRDADWGIGSAVIFLDTLDDALERFEEQRLATIVGCPLAPSRSDSEGEATALGLSRLLLANMHRVRFAESEVLLRQGSSSDVMHIVLSGTLVVNHVEEDGSRRRLRRATRGAVLGEIGVLTGEDRSAEVMADSDVEVLALTAERYEQLRCEHPALALELQDFLLLGMAERTVRMSDSLNGALR